jgi:Cft2 family RNA processing exonuclease
VRLEGDALPNLAWLEENKVDVKAIFITHAHQDHIGALPLVSALYPGAHVFMTQATWDVARVMLHDALRLASFGQAQRVFTEDQLEALQTRIKIMGQDKTFAWEGMRVSTFSAGHILGAVSIGFETESEGSVLFTGDFSVTRSRLLDGTRLPAARKYDILVTEATYGDRLHANRAEQERALVEKIVHVISRGGHVLIPAFAVGRAQEVLMILLDAMRHNPNVPKFPVVVDGLVRSVCPIYESYPHLLSGPARRILHTSGRLFHPRYVNFVNSAEERKNILSGPPTCIIASSGMLNGGPSVFYAAELAGQEKNAILLCGYQDEEAPGRQLMTLVNQPVNERKWILPDRVVNVRCELAFYSLSAHADRRELVAATTQMKPKKVIVVHGDDEAKRTLARELNQAGIDVVIPEVCDTVDCGRVGQIVNLDLPEEDVANWIEECQGRVIVYCTGEGQYDIGVCLQLGDRFLKVQTRSGIVEFVPAASAVAVIGPIPPGEEKVRYMNMLWGAAWAALAEGRVFGARPAEKVAYYLVHGHRTCDHGEGSFVELLEPYGYRYMKNDYESRTLTVFLNFPWLVSDDVKKQVEERVCRLGWNVRIENKIYPPALMQLVKNTLKKSCRDDLIVGTPSMYYDEKRVVIPITGSFTEQEKTAWEKEWSAAIGGIAVIKRVLPGEAEAKKKRVTQSDAVRIIKETVPAEFGLYRVGVDEARGVLKLYVYFPDALLSMPGVNAWARDMQDRLGWIIEWQDTVHQGQLAIAAVGELPVAGSPSIDLSRKVVTVKLAEPVDQELLKDHAERFKKLTGWKLQYRYRFNGTPVVKPQMPSASCSGSSCGARMEINKAINFIEKNAVERGIRVYKKSCRGDRIELRFITPEYAARWKDWMEEMSRCTGWDVVAAATPNQQALIECAVQIVSRDCLVKNPSIYFERRGVGVRLTRGLSEAEKEEFRKQTGWELLPE